MCFGVGSAECLSSLHVFCVLPDKLCRRSKIRHGWMNTLLLKQCSFTRAVFSRGNTTCITVSERISRADRQSKVVDLIDPPEQKRDSFTSVKSPAHRAERNIHEERTRVTSTASSSTRQRLPGASDSTHSLLPLCFLSLSINDASPNTLSGLS